MEFKKYCLLENGQIALSNYYEMDGSLIGPRDIKKKGNDWFLTHDIYAHNTFITYTHKIIAFSDSFEELVKIKERKHI